MQKIVIKYPPDFDGELHVNVTEETRSFTYTFTMAKGIPPCTPWEGLVEASNDIIAQENRRLKRRANVPTPL